MSETMEREVQTVQSGEWPRCDYGRAAEFTGFIEEKDVSVPMRDGVNLSIDVYRPDTNEKLPVLLAFAIYNKDLQGPAVSDALPPQPAWSTLWTGPLEAGDSRFFASRGYVHVIGSPRGVGKSGSGGDRWWDSYDLIEWIAEQPWCDGNVGMVGISGFGAEQLHVAKQRPPHLKAIFPLDSRGAYGPFGGFRDEYPGGVIHLFRFLIGIYSAFHQNRGAPGELPPEKEELWRKAMENPDYRMYPHLYNVVAQKGQHMPPFFELLINPYDSEAAVEKSEAEFANIDVPTHTGSGWYAYTYKTHLNGCQTWFERINAPKKLTLGGPAHLERPFRSYHREMLRWYDHWLKGLDTGIMDEPPVKVWVMGANKWLTATDWPLPEIRWTRFYLNSWERLTDREFTAGSVDDAIPPDTFVQMPPTHTNQVQRLQYLTDPLSEDMLIVGPSALHLFAEIDQDDTNWIVALNDVGPDVSVMSAREGERERPADTPGRELTRGWLKASHRALDDARSRPGRPWHPLTREAQAPVTPGEIEEYAIGITSTANLFRKGHRLAVDIMCLDLPTGVGGATNVEYVPYHICSSKTTVHRIYHDTKRPSHLLLPVVPLSSVEWL